MVHVPRDCDINMSKQKVQFFVHSITQLILMLDNTCTIIGTMLPLDKQVNTNLRSVTKILRARRQRHIIHGSSCLISMVIMHGPLKSEEATASSASMLVTPLNLHRQMLAQNTSTLTQGTLLFFDRLHNLYLYSGKRLDTTKDNTV